MHAAKIENACSDEDAREGETANTNTMKDETSSQEGQHISSRSEHEEITMSCDAEQKEEEPHSETV